LSVTLDKIERDSTTTNPLVVAFDMSRFIGIK